MNLDLKIEEVDRLMIELGHAPRDVLRQIEELITKPLLMMVIYKILPTRQLKQQMKVILRHNIMKDMIIFILHYSFEIIPNLCSDTWIYISVF